MNLMLKSFMLVLMVILLKNTVAYGNDLNCLRTTNSSVGWRSAASFNEVWPKKLNLPFDIFAEADVSSKILTREIEYESGHTRVLRLLPNKKMIGWFRVLSNFQKPDQVRYKCNYGSNEVRQLLASSGSANKPDSNPTSTVEKSCFDGNVANCTKEQLCNRATSTRNGNKEWESINQFQPFVAEAKSRGLSCGVTEPTTSPTSKSKLDKAKSTCTELGFTLGTEKHGDCVLKMMDN